MLILAKKFHIVSVALPCARISETLTRTMASAKSSDNLSKFKSAMQHIYGPFESLSASEAKTWTPADLAEGHKGRYLWTDGFAVVNFLTLYKESGRDEKYLNCAQRLVEKVHSVLGRTRDGTSRLRPATEEEPLLGGLRIGKLESHGEDGDGQYFHYLTVWMYALHQMSLASGNAAFLQQAISLAKAVHPKFVYNQNSSRARMYWKMSMDLREPLVMSEGNLDPIDGYVIYKLLQKGANQFQLPPDSLSEEIAIFRKIVETKYPNYSSSDSLDLGMTLWTTHFLLGEEDWAGKLTKTAQSCLSLVVKKGHFDRPFSRRLAFRDFGTVLGVKCHEGEEDGFRALVEKIVGGWEDHGTVPIPKKGTMTASLEPITLVMYATALIPGAFRNGFWKD